MQIIKSSRAALTTTKSIQEICRPLKKITGLTGFGYHKILPGGKEIHLSNNLKWIKYVYQNNCTIGAEYLPYLETLKAANFKCTLWPTDPKQKLVNEARLYFDTGYGITLWNNNNEYFGFSLLHQKDISAINIFMNNMEHLERFCRLFTEKAKNIITTVSSDILLSANTTNPLKNFSYPDSNILDNPIYSFKAKLTTREIECLNLLTKGYTIPEVAINLEISRRTAETHLENIKNKTGTSSKSELIKFIFSNNFDKYF